MRVPIRALSQNLMWTHAGATWALWRMAGLPYGFRPPKDKAEARTVHTGLLRSMPKESLWLSVCATLDPASVVSQMIADVDLDAHQDWAAECEATLDTLEQIGLGQRVHFLAVPLRDVGGRQQAGAVAAAAESRLRAGLGLPPAPIAPGELTRRQAQARKIRESLPAPFHADPVTPAQVVWLHEHMSQRGLGLSEPFPESEDRVAEELMTPRSAAVLTEPLLDEGARSDLEPGQSRIVNPAGRRFVKVTQPHALTEIPASYQAMLCVTDAPSLMSFPGSELLGRIDESGLEVDWAMRLTVRSSEEVQRANSRALRNLNEQYNQREGEVSHGLSALGVSADALAEYAATMESDKLEVECAPAFIFAVAADSAEAVNERATLLANHLGSAGYRLARPLGAQAELWWSMVPGSPATRAITEFAQIMPSANLAATIPYASTDLGDRSGSALGKNISAGRGSVVLHDVAGASLRDTSGSLGVVGMLGAGKSVLLKKLSGDVVHRGGQIVVPDRTQVGEWAHWANSVTDARIIDIAAPQISLDPLRIFGPGEGARVAQSFLTPLLNVSPTSELGVVLSEALDPEYLEAQKLRGLGDLVEHLHQGGDLDDPEGAKMLAKKLRVFSRKDFGRVLFDDQLPAMRPDAPATVIRTHTLEMPKRDELVNAHLFEQMRLERVFGRACYALIAGLARTVCFADTSRLGAFPVDEAHHLTSSPEGAQEITDFIRDGRRHQAAVFLGSHDAQEDFGNETLRGLIPTRILMRHTDKTLAARGLEFLDLDPTDEDLLDLVINDTSPMGPSGVIPGREGEGFMRDSSGRVGRIRVLAPSHPVLREAVMTTPKAGV